MPRETYVMRGGKLVPKRLAGPHPSARSMNRGVMPDIQDFETTDGQHIRGRAGLREYEQRTGLRQLGNDLVCGRNEDGSMAGRIVEELPDVRPTIEAAMRRHR